MNQLKPIFSFLPVIPLLIVLGLSTASAQTDASATLEPSYEISLHLVIGSNEPGPGAPLPSSLSNIAKHLKSNFAFSNYRLANTFLGRVSNNGNLEYKSVGNILGQETDADAQTFLEWTLGLRAVPNGFLVRPFRFGARIPVHMAKDAAVVYEQVGLMVGSTSFRIDSPTLVGTISLPKTTGTVFLIATIKSAEM